MEIKTSKGETILVDKQDYDLVSKLNWYVNKVGYAANDSKPRKLMHRFLLQFPTSGVDHINGNKLDNRRANLRLCNQSQNSSNARLRSSNTSGYKGVSWDKKARKWSAFVTKDYKHIFGGYFNTPQEAYERYKELASEHHGVYARYA